MLFQRIIEVRKSIGGRLQCNAETTVLHFKQLKTRVKPLGTIVKQQNVKIA